MVKYSQIQKNVFARDIYFLICVYYKVTQVHISIHSGKFLINNCYSVCNTNSGLLSHVLFGQVCVVDEHRCHQMSGRIQSMK